MGPKVVHIERAAFPVSITFLDVMILVLFMKKYLGLYRALIRWCMVQIFELQENLTRLQF